MNDRLHVVLIDDNPDDRALVIRELRREFAEPRIEEVTDARGFDRVLERAGASLVITDYQLRWTDGLTVLRTIKGRWGDCPVIMFTGTGSEEIAVEAMKAGLDDYVLKSPKHYARLPAAARLALRMGRQRRALREAESRYSTLFDTVPVGLYRATPRGEILDANPALVEMLGYPDPGAMVGVSAGDLYVRKGDYEVWRGRLEREGVVHNFEAQLRSYDGKTCWAETSARAVRDPATGETIYEGSLKDISQRKEAEDEREKLIAELQDALSKINTLSGLLPICASCKKIRDDKGYWNQIEVYIQSHSDAEFTHSFCPDCMQQLYPEVVGEGFRAT